MFTFLDHWLISAPFPEVESGSQADTQMVCLLFREAGFLLSMEKSPLVLALTRQFIVAPIRIALYSVFLFEDRRLCLQSHQGAFHQHLPGTGCWSKVS